MGEYIYIYPHILPEKKSEMPRKKIKKNQNPDLTPTTTTIYNWFTKEGITITMRKIIISLTNGSSYHIKYSPETISRLKDPESYPFLELVTTRGESVVIKSSFVQSFLVVGDESN